MELLVPLTEKQQDEIYEEVGYNRAQLEQDVGQIREWLAEQHHLPPSRLKEPDCFFKTYLTGCKGSLEKVKKKLDAYYTYRGNSELFENRDPLEEEYATKSKTYSLNLLPRLSKRNELLLFAVLTTPDTSKYSVLAAQKKIINIFELEMRMPGVIAHSTSYIVDLKHITAAHYLMMPIPLIRDMLDIIQNVLPFRIKHIIIINMPSLLVAAMNNLVKPFMSKKLKERFQMFSGGYEELYQFFDKSLLPKDYGGDDPKLAQELDASWEKKVLSERNWFMNELSEHTDESKRISLDGTILQDSHFGVHGSLKKLIID